jgi:hypothetical protein
MLRIACCALVLASALTPALVFCDSRDLKKFLTTAFLSPAFAAVGVDAAAESRRAEVKRGASDETDPAAARVGTSVKATLDEEDDDEEEEDEEEEEEEKEDEEKEEDEAASACCASDGGFEGDEAASAALTEDAEEEELMEEEIPWRSKQERRSGMRGAERRIGLKERLCMVNR